MYRPITLLLTTVFLFFVTYVKAQNSSFSSVATGKTWVVSKYNISFSNKDIKDVFSNFSFKFLGDNAAILAIDNSESKADTCYGTWHEQNGKVDLDLTYEADDKANYRIAFLLNKAEMQEAEISSSKLSFRIPDVMGYIDVEFTEK